jgi:hypothetical protein
MRKLIVVVTLAAAPLLAATPAVAGTAGHQAVGSGAADVVIVGLAREGRAQPPSAPPVPQARDAATPRQSADTKSGGETAVLPRHHHDDTEMASTGVGAQAAPEDQASAGTAQARAPPGSA